MSVTPLLPALADHLRVQKIGRDLAAMIFGFPPAPAVRRVANTLIRPEFRGFECMLAEATKARRRSWIPPRSELQIDSLEENRNRQLPNPM
jgi:hypothetical protein